MNHTGHHQIRPLADRGTCPGCRSAFSSSSCRWWSWQTPTASCRWLTSCRQQCSFAWRTQEPMDKNIWHIIKMLQIIQECESAVRAFISLSNCGSGSVFALKSSVPDPHHKTNRGTLSVHIWVRNWTAKMKFRKQRIKNLVPWKGNPSTPSP